MKIRILFVLAMTSFFFLMDHKFPSEELKKEVEQIVSKDMQTPLAKIYFDLEKYKATIHENGEGYITIEKVELPSINGKEEALIEANKSLLVQRLKPPSEDWMGRKLPLSLSYSP